jgi:cytochrome c biogenesis protein ResB
MEQSRRKAIGSLIFGIGFVAILIGALTDVYPTTTGVIIGLGVWIIGGAAVVLVFGGEEDG